MLTEQLTLHVLEALQGELKTQRHVRLPALLIIYNGQQLLLSEAAIKKLLAVILITSYISFITCTIISVLLIKVKGTIQASNTFWPTRYWWLTTVHMESTITSVTKQHVLLQIRTKHKLVLII
jgi:hypothetical protein